MKQVAPRTEMVRGALPPGSATSRASWTEHKDPLRKDQKCPTQPSAKGAPREQ